MIAELAVVGASLAGHVGVKRFVRNRLKYTRWVDHPKPLIGIGVGAATAVGVAALPLVTFFWGGALIGLGVGTGAALGAKEANRRR